MTVCLVMLHACGYAASEATGGGHGASAAVERGTTHAEGRECASRRDAGFVVEQGDGKPEEECSAPGRSVIAVGKATEPVDEGAREVAGAAGVVTVQVGECSGRRFKKCR